MAEIVVVPNVSKTWSENSEYVFLPVPMSDGTFEPCLLTLDVVRGGMARARKDKRDIPPRRPWWAFWRTW